MENNEFEKWNDTTPKGQVFNELITRFIERMKLSALEEI